MDQAASLRAWALEKARNAQQEGEPRAAESDNRKLVVAGLETASPGETDRVHGRLQAWEAQGAAWVGQSRDWLVIPLGLSATSIDRAQCGGRHWALWIDNDIRAFDKGYRGLKLINSLGGPRQILALHEPGIRRKGLLDNLITVATAYFGIQLVALAN